MEAPSLTLHSAPPVIPSLDIIEFALTIDVVSSSGKYTSTLCFAKN